MKNVEEKNLTILSVCIPMYNHADRMYLQISSLNEFRSDKRFVEFIIVDDASDDDVLAVVNNLSNAGWRVIYARQEFNKGRAPALSRAIKLATGQFVMLMDADDTFLPGALDLVLRDIESIDCSGSNDAANSLVGMVYGVEISDNSINRFVLPPSGLETSLLSLRADSKISGDLKEVVRRDLVLGALCPLFESYRRVPTSLLWARISESGKVKCVSVPIVRKVYLASGMTKNLSKYRLNSTEPLLVLYKIIATSNAYKSFFYRLKALVNYHRFLIWSESTAYKSSFSMGGLPLMIGISYGYLEKISRILNRFGRLKK